MAILNDKIKEYKLIKLNNLIHDGVYSSEYHMAHIKLTRHYAMKLANKLSPNIDIPKLQYTALAHDLLKDRNYDCTEREITKSGIKIPRDLNWYVRTNLDILEPYGLDDYFNTDIQLHALASGIYLIKELNIDDREILYPVFFHSCPIISIYEKLNPNIQLLVDIIELADKLSSNNIKLSNNKVKYNLEHAVFGKNNNEFNFSLGLLITRVIAQGGKSGEHGKLATDYYLNRLMDNQPFVTNKILEEIKSWLKK